MIIYFPDFEQLIVVDESRYKKAIREFAHSDVMRTAALKALGNDPKKAREIIPAFIRYVTKSLEQGKTVDLGFLVFYPNMSAYFRDVTQLSRN